MREAIAAFLSKFGHPPDDEPVIDYLEMLMSTSDGAEMAEVSCEFLEGASPAFASKDEQDKLPCVLELYEQAQAMKEPPACQCDGPALSGAEAQPQGMCNSSGSSSSRRGSAELPPLGALSINPSGAKSWKQEEQGLDSCDVSDQGSGTHPEVAQLQVLCPCSLHADFLTHILLVHGGLEAAVDWVLEVGDDIQQHESQWLERRRQTEREAQRARMLAQQNREKILERYDLEALKTVPAGYKKPSKQKDDLLLPQMHDKEPQSKVRYINGVPVFCKKGEKFITETIKEDWDGGSKGKVYTKGKRGKGFV
uniref:Uncharacterized protein n=1 Tax=Dunaliella tertiolecta TaxID=3047 RepID=A0A7S3R3Z7_DUNTE|mmetsp:Transcript_30037/g.77875  ORF Transcript_30037/g.77875 Transcript_30037/m.77875 type:complete len:309 (-) Transcript_30037:756-1682(-)